MTAGIYLFVNKINRKVKSKLADFGCVLLSLSFFIGTEESVFPHRGIKA